MELLATRTVVPSCWERQGVTSYAYSSTILLEIPAGNFILVWMSIQKGMNRFTVALVSETVMDEYVVD
jgi:hypothetical protein